jgi:metallo-beta-lactamase class B
VSGHKPAFLCLFLARDIISCDFVLSVCKTGIYCSKRIDSSFTSPDMLLKNFSLLCLILVLMSCKTAKVLDKKYSSKTITVEKVTDHVYQHTSYLQTDSFGNVPCNGMVVVDGNEAIVFDTPTNDSTSLELLNWIKNSLKCKVVAVIPTHFHNDCLGGLNAFHENKIPSYASNKTIELARLNGEAVPQKGFDGIKEFKVGNKIAIAEFNGEGHTKDNVIGYFPSEKTMFGGCLIKELKATKGYLGDANVDAWSATVTKVKSKYPDTKVVIPGHGKWGDISLLDYTIELFEKK